MMKRFAHSVFLHLLGAGLLLAASAVQAQSVTEADSLAKKGGAATGETRSVPLRKSPTGAMLRSMALPGWGQWYNEKRIKAVVIMGAEAGLVIDAIVQNQLAARSGADYEREYYRNNRSLAIWWLGAVILYSMADAYVDAHLFDFDERPDLSLAPPGGGGPGESGAAFVFNLALHF